MVSSAMPDVYVSRFWIDYRREKIMAAIPGFPDYKLLS